MSRRRIVDTNVPIVANGDKSPQASPECRLACVKELDAFFKGQRQLVIDDDWRVLKEYQANLYPSNGGLGDRFLQWVLQNSHNPQACVQVHLPLHATRSFEDFPDDDRLAGFDPEDRKWVALSRASASRSSEHTPIVQATDMKWRNFELTLREYEVSIDFICDVVPPIERKRGRRRQ